jgi:17beta-estradiol 17-dehydrogenase / very-long-chain 3-oxoacyl-CoA reductase
MTINAIFPTLITNALMPTIKQNQPGLVINIGSYAGVHGLPWISVYSASKSFNHTFSKALSKELIATGNDVEVLGIVVGSVKSAGNPDETLSFVVLDPDEMAESIIDRVGCGKDVVTGNWRQSFAADSLMWFPDSIVRLLLTAEIKKRIAIEAKHL